MENSADAQLADAREKLIRYAVTARTVIADGLTPLVDTFEKAAYARALAAVLGEQLHEDADNEADNAYRQAIGDAAKAVENLIA